MNRLRALYEEMGQSPWIDDLQRAWLQDGTLARWVERGVRGVTSNPTRFEQAISGTEDYDEQFRALIREGRPVDNAYWTMVVDDITEALRVLRPVHDASGGRDGFVSVELDPAVAHDSAASVEAARGLHDRIDQPNLFVKIPGTAEGLDAIRQMIAEGRSINVTLLFSLERHDQVMEAYLSGLEACTGDLSGVHSVASFFVSRVDTEIDRRLEEIGTPDALQLRGGAALAQARLAYQQFTQQFSGPRWEALAARGANRQRPLWASTSSKNPAYPDTLYVDNLIGPDTVNTMPPETLEAFDDHGTLQRTVDPPPEFHVADEHLGRLAEVGIDLGDVARTLEKKGVRSFADSFNGLIETLTAKARRLQPAR